MPFSMTTSRASALSTYGTRSVCGHFVIVVPAVLVGPSARRCRTCKSQLPAGVTEQRYPTKLALTEDLLRYAFLHPPHHVCHRKRNHD